MLPVYCYPYFCCRPSAPGEVKAADAHLCQMFGQEPRDAVAQARLGVVEAWQQNYSSAARRLSKLSEKDLACLDFLLALIPVNQQKRTAQVCLGQEATILFRDIFGKEMEMAAGCTMTINCNIHI